MREETPLRVPFTSPCQDEDQPALTSYEMSVNFHWIDVTTQKILPHSMSGLKDKIYVTLAWYAPVSFIISSVHVEHL
jgi:hypothetical protein